jgi:hypothetical protein
MSDSATPSGVIDHGDGSVTIVAPTIRVKKKDA